MKKLIKILLIILLGIFTIPATGFIVLQNRNVQTYLAERIARSVSENLEAELSIGSVDMILFNRVVMTNVLLKDRHLDTLLYAPGMVATLRSLNRKHKTITLSRLKMEHATIRLSSDTAKVFNLSFIINILRKPPDPDRHKWTIGIRSIDFEDSRFLYENHFSENINDKGIDFTNVSIAGMDLEMRDLSIQNDTVSFRIRHLDFIEKSGFELTGFSGLAGIGRQFMNLENLRVITPSSDITADRLDFRFNSWKDFGNQGFGSKVRFLSDFRPSTLYLDDLAFFSTALSGIDRTIMLSGSISGRVGSLKGRNITLDYNNHTHFEGNFDMDGLPDIQETYMFFDIDELTTTVTDIESLQRPGEPSDTGTLSEPLAQLGNITYRGKYAGFINDFVTYGDFSTDLGQISSDLSIRPDSLDNVHYSGKLTTEGFDFGRLIDMDETAGIINMSGNVEGVNYKGGDIHANMDADISLLEFNDYPYQNIHLAGDLANNKFDGSFTVEDPNLKMQFTGKIDFADTLPVFDFTANVDKALLNPLNITASDPGYTLSCYLRANFTGVNPDDFDGEINLVNSLFQKKDKQIQIYDLNLFAQHRPDTNRMILRSDLVDAEITGQYEFVDIGKASARLLSHHLPALRNLTGQNAEEVPELNDFDFSIHFKNTQPITDFFFPELGLSKNSMLSGNYNPSGYKVQCTGHFPGLRFRDSRMEDLEVNLVSNDSLAEFSSDCGMLEYGGLIHLDHLNLGIKAEKDSIFYNANWKDTGHKEINRGNLAGLASFAFRPDNVIPRIRLEMEPGQIVVRDTVWNIYPALVQIDSSSVRVNKARIAHGNQSFLMEGTVSELPSDVLEFRFDDFNLAHLNQTFQNKEIELQGILNGSSRISDVYNKPTFTSDISIDTLILNGEELGNTFITARWIDPEQKVALDVQSLRGLLKTLVLKGDYYPESRNIDFDLALDKLRLNLFAPYLSTEISDLNGIASGDLRLSGTTGKPLFNGTVEIRKTSLRVDYLQTSYSFSDAVEIRDNDIFFRDFEIFDESGSRSVLNGSIKNKYLRDFVFDLNLEADNFNFLATREGQNEYFFGDAFASGLLRFSGSQGDLNLFVSARTERGTHIFIPANEGRSIQENNFITFINTGERRDAEYEREDRRSDRLSGLGLEINLEVTRDATAEIIFDPQVGDIMKGNGTGNIQMIIDPQGDFQMFGEYVIESGEYLFTLQNIINKKLNVQNGGTITWNGDPTGAVIDMHAIYIAKAAPGTLVPDPPEYLMKRMPVECHLIMTGNLLSPLISFDIQIPTAEAETRNILKNAISTEEELTKQFLSLLVINNFSSVSSQNEIGAASSTGAGMAGVTASELLSNQLSNWLSQISNDFDIGVNYRPGDEISSDEVEVALSTQILNDRVTIHTNVDVSSQESSTVANSRTNTIAGDFDVDVKITESGKFRFKAYNRYNHDQLYKTSPYTQGVGFVYREDFNNLGELRRRYLDALLRNNRNERDPEP